MYLEALDAMQLPERECWLQGTDIISVPSSQGREKSYPVFDIEEFNLQWKNATHQL